MITLEKLPYEFNVLEPVIDAKTVEIHYTKHHQWYVNKLNELIVWTEFENMNLEEIVKKSEWVMFNNAAQTWNHTFYRNGLKSFQEGNLPSWVVLEKINEKRWSFDNFKSEFEKSAVWNFWSGRTWLVKNEDWSLWLLNTSNAQTPITQWITPLFVVDVWEHAYYLKYQNRRVEYVQNFWNLVNRDFVNNNYGL